MRKIIILLICWLIPVSVMAQKVAVPQKVAVLPVFYWLVWKNAESVEKAQAIQDEVVQGAVEVGFEVVTGAEVEDAVWAAAGIKTIDCRDTECLSKVAEKLGVDNAFFVSLTEEGLLYNVEIIQAKGEPQSGPLGGNFAKLKTGVRSMMKAALRPTSSEPEPMIAPEPVPDSEEEPEAEEPVSGKESKEISPTPFYLTAGLTSAIAITYIVTEAIGYNRYKELEDKEQNDDWQNDKNSLESLQITSRIFMGITAVGAIATTVLFFLTDFDQREVQTSNEEVTTSISPAPTANGGMIVINGRF